MNKCILAGAFSFLVLISPTLLFAGGQVVGMYGVSTGNSSFDVGGGLGLKKSGVNAVFVRSESNDIEYFATQQFKVYLTLNVFGGREPWKAFPDSNPVTADGTQLSGSYGGVCPTHPQWRENRLHLLKQWLTDFGGDNGISGIWLDYIRYPGRWEHEEPFLADTCYCPRCLSLFQEETRVKIPEGLSVEKTAEWIHQNAALQWMEWKKTQIVSFAMEARKLVDRHANGQQLLLGAFLVPWKKSEHDGAISFQLAQDAELLAPYIDVLSPMVYHKMVGKPVSWIGEITRYYRGLVDVPIWPIIQAEDLREIEFSRAISEVTQANADGLLVYSHRYMTDDLWPPLEEVHFEDNLLSNPHLYMDDPEKAPEQSLSVKGHPQFWFTPPAEAVLDSRFYFDTEADQKNNSIGLTAGLDRKAMWSTEIQQCEPGSEYQFSADFFRNDREDGLAYPEITVWGQKYRLNTHRAEQKWQKLKVQVSCPATYSKEESSFIFHNNYPSTSFWMRSPWLVKVAPGDGGPHQLPPKTRFFPIGAYGAKPDNLDEFKSIGLNTAVVPMNYDNISKCLDLSMHCTLSVPRDPEKLLLMLDDLALLHQGKFSYYVNDEPGIHSFPESKAEDIQNILKDRFPAAVTNMAIVRPQAIPYYEKGADYFMLDQYPVPNMPMTWLSDSMDEAAEYVGRNRLQSVIQAFGGRQYASSGWPRLPTFAEMNCLSFLSIIHGSRGLYFYTFPSIMATAEGREDFSLLIRRLNSLRSWLQIVNDQKPVEVQMTSVSQVDPKGQPAVHCSTKEQFHTQLLICVNTINTSVEAEIGVAENRQHSWREYYTSVPYAVADKTILARFSPLEVKVLLEER
ncbi:hypothetical protein [Desulforhopalus sp. IMCC35007]|uniref:hypothetical protein n=1 Tax=Desulforhopalus sp. IMCC35007 TaxID=2569543 RepID=UPI0010AEB078|nr:hypothetical protein [Desulforhopalus sp. IMCC35007]TKB09924.1 hypothetical protein FCL48_08120 [Desulforhopalus sp. IMCC35007]